MPVANRFRHQEYRVDRPDVPIHLLAPEPSAFGPDAVGDAYRAAGVCAIVLVHGTFVGTDASGLIGELSRLAPGLGARLRRWRRRAAEYLAGDAGLYTADYACALEDAAGVPVRLFLWSSENNHVGRSRAAVRLLEELTDLEPQGRVLVWGHSHGGNVLALVSNLLGGDQASRRAFFSAARLRKRRVRRALRDHRLTLDVVTFGTPVRYGWETRGYAKLLHFIHHRPVPGLPEHLARFPPDGGDEVQQIGVAGTDFVPPVPAWCAERRLRHLLQPGLRKRDLLARLKLGVRVPDEGCTLLVDYGELHDRVAGHAVYTRRRWLPFHAAEVARRLYAVIG